MREAPLRTNHRAYVGLLSRHDAENFMKAESRKSNGKASETVRELVALAVAAEKEAEAARKRARLAKASFKEARKAFKQAKKAAKRVRKEARFAAEMLQAKAKARAIPQKPAVAKRPKPAAKAEVKAKPTVAKAAPRPRPAAPTRPIATLNPVEPVRTETSPAPPPPAPGQVPVL